MRLTVFSVWRGRVVQPSAFSRHGPSARRRSKVRQLQSTTKSSALVCCRWVVEVVHSVLAMSWFRRLLSITWATGLPCALSFQALGLVSCNISG